MQSGILCCKGVVQARVAMASAALGGREHVSPEDLMKAVKLVILPRSDLSQIVPQEVRSTLLLSTLERPAARFCETRAEGHGAQVCVLRE